MEGFPRHQCLIYDGSPAKALPAIASEIKERLITKDRCLYLNSPAMVMGIRSYLYARGVNIADEEARSNLILSSEQIPHRDGQFAFNQM